MLCYLAVQLAREGGYMLRVNGSAAVGGSGPGGRDAKHYPTRDALLGELEALGLGPEVIAAAERELNGRDARNRFVKFADNVQIPFETLERADIYLFD